MPTFSIFFYLIPIGLIFYYAFNSERAVTKKRLTYSPLKKIKDVTDDEIVKITGQVQFSGKMLRAPISGRECAYYYIRITGRVSDPVNDLLDAALGSGGR